MSISMAHTKRNDKNNKDTNDEKDAVLEITRKKEKEAFISDNRRAIIFYVSPDCPACMEMKPLYYRIANRYSERVSFSIIDVKKAGLQLEVVPILEGYYMGKGIHMMEGIDTQSLKQFVRMIINYRPQKK
jgi:thiol-disulfide isomerase/thioredoxin